MSAKLSRRVVARAAAAELLAYPDEIHKWLERTAAFLLEEGRTNEANLLVNDIAHELYVRSGHLLVDVTSARPLPAAVKEELKRTFREATGAHSVVLVEHVDPSLIGGLIARTPSAQLDLSVRTKLKKLATIS